MVVVFCKNLPQLWEILLFIREMNESVMVIQATLFTSNYNYRVVRILLFPQSIVHIS